jgi:hypothetical protein
MDRWQKHLPLASASMVSTFEKAGQLGVQFSPAERALFMACEFWTAVSTRRLAAHPGMGSIDALRYMSMIYLSMGAHGVASAVIVAIGELECAPRPQDRHQCLATLQEKLLKTRDPVDQMIARLAESLGLGSRSTAKWEPAKWEPASVLISTPA